VRNNQGRWNLASLLEATRKFPRLRPPKLHPRAAPVFPYLEASNARVNFKLGQNEKKILRADECRRGAVAGFGQFLERSHQGGTRAHGFPPTDTGLVQINARCSAFELRWTPLDIAGNGRKDNSADHPVAKRKRPGMARRSQFCGKVVGTPKRCESRARPQSGISALRYCPTPKHASGELCSGQYDAVTAALSDLLCVAGRQRRSALRGVFQTVHTRPLTTSRLRPKTASSRGGSTAAATRNSNCLAIFGERIAERRLQRGQGGPPYFREFPPDGQYEEWTGKGSAINVILSSGMRQG